VNTVGVKTVLAFNLFIEKSIALHLHAKSVKEKMKRIKSEGKER